VKTGRFSRRQPPSIPASNLPEAAQRSGTRARRINIRPPPADIPRTPDRRRRPIPAPDCAEIAYLGPGTRATNSAKQHGIAAHRVGAHVSIVLEEKNARFVPAVFIYDHDTRKIPRRRRMAGSGKVQQSVGRAAYFRHDLEGTARQAANSARIRPTRLRLSRKDQLWAAGAPAGPFIKASCFARYRPTPQKKPGHNPTAGASGTATKGGLVEAPKQRATKGEAAWGAARGKKKNQPRTGWIAGAEPPIFFADKKASATTTLLREMALRRRRPAPITLRGEEKTPPIMAQPWTVCDGWPTVGRKGTVEAVSEPAPHRNEAQGISRQHGNEQCPNFRPDRDRAVPAVPQSREENRQTRRLDLAGKPGPHRGCSRDSVSQAPATVGPRRRSGIRLSIVAIIRVRPPPHMCQSKQHVER